MAKRKPARRFVVGVRGESRALGRNLSLPYKDQDWLDACDLMTANEAKRASKRFMQDDDVVIYKLVPVKLKK